MAKDKSTEKEQSAVKKAADTAKKSGNKKNQNESFGDFWQGVRHELSKVVWPTKQELLSYTVVVIATCTAFAVAFWLMDMGILEVLKQLLGVTLS